MALKCISDTRLRAFTCLQYTFQCISRVQGPCPARHSDIFSHTAVLFILFHFKCLLLSDCVIKFRKFLIRPESCVLISNLENRPYHIDHVQAN